MKVEVKLSIETNGTTERRLSKKKKDMAVWGEWSQHASYTCIKTYTLIIKIKY